MNKLLTLLACVSVTSAGAASVGGFVGTDAGVYYQTNALNGSTRYGLTALGIFSNQVKVAGEVAYLRDFGGNASGTFGALTPYYGVGLGAGIGLGASNSFSVYPHALVGLRYNTPTPLGFFGELNAGVNASFGAGTDIRFGGGARIGIDYKLGN